MTSIMDARSYAREMDTLLDNYMRYVQEESEQQHGCLDAIYWVQRMLNQIMEVDKYDR